MNTNKRLTPCVGICSATALGDEVCRGCGRTADEVLGWNQMDADEKRVILDRLKIQDSGILNAYTRTKPVVFLDIDGVIGEVSVCQGSGWEERYPELFLKRKKRSVPGDMVFKPLVDMLFSALDKHDVQVIIVSSWCYPFLGPKHPDIESLKELFGYDAILGSLETGGGVSRGRLVKSFVEHLEPPKWAVIDDSYDQMYEDRVFFEMNMVHPHGRFGIGLKEIERLELILTDPSPDDVWERGLHGL